ncbi:MAG: acetyl-CoA carboxylase biotin carboxyl carrier protein subunit [Crocinitomicaceae bacterium]|jgi:biotin carboxyl carrier protein|nr:acetyl-CoA carboxylase biotin carboxyl carrier protein subunit [Crocinitomicaceae bacterium]MBK6951672.1 acetyl-CoA carboxylase biotin carboxyl carrier protein subunit [Crocinitomicaceae bacterium]MBK9590107.1 acetyl-CoA carboxylase biotin carboxyl carrier protein subunit [Crocinitomicaceae bacterium]
MSVTVNTMNLLKDSNPSELKVLGENVYSVQNGDSDLILEVLKVDLADKTMTIRSSHRTFDIVFKDELDLVLDKMGIKRSAEVVSKNIKAPMPGKVLEVLANVGDKLMKGDNVLILEAMKMENVIKAEMDCVIKKIHIAKLENVEKNQILIELDFAD